MNKTTPTQRAKLRQLKRRGEASRDQAILVGVKPKTADKTTRDIPGPTFQRRKGPLDR